MDLPILPTLPTKISKISIHPRGTDEYKEDYKRYLKQYAQEHKETNKVSYNKFMNKYTDEERKRLTKLYNRRKYVKKILNQQTTELPAV